MRIQLIIAFLFFSVVSFGQTSFLTAAAEKLDKALVAKDTVTLKQLLHKNVSYGHSNGWVETKEDVIKDLANGKLIYSKIESKDSKWTVDKEWASVRTTAKVEVTMNGTKLDLNLHVLQIWWKTNKGWQLIARQSTKLP